MYPLQKLAREQCRPITLSGYVTKESRNCKTDEFQISYCTTVTAYQKDFADMSGNDSDSSGSDFDEEEIQRQLKGMQSLLHRYVGQHKVEFLSYLYIYIFLSQNPVSDSIILIVIICLLKSILFKTKNNTTETAYLKTQTFLTYI